MKTIQTICATAAALICCSTLLAEVPLKILEGESATTTRKSLTVLCQTSPDASASINGQELHVYRTGAFGTVLTLEPGTNTIMVRVKMNGEEASKKIEVKYTPKPAARPEAPKEKPFAALDAYGLTKEWAALLYGTGTDRLGGSKMGYIDEGIVLKITGKTGNLYKVQLSENRYAYINEEDIQLSMNLSTNTVNSGNLSIVNGGKSDVITLPLIQRHPYASSVNVKEGVLYVDLFGVTNNSNWVTHRRDLEMIDWVECRQIESDVLRLEIALQKKHIWGYAIKYDGNNLRISVKHAPQEFSLNNLNIGLDAGHGGSALGAVSVTGAYEKDINLDLCFRVKKLLEERGATVSMTRTTDESVSMTERKVRMLKADVDMLVSIHNNAGGSAIKPMGTSCYYKHIQNREFAACILDRLMKMEGVPNFGLTGNFNFALGTPTEYPTMLVEGLFVSSMPDEEKLLMEDSRQEIAERIVAGIEDYLEAVRRNP